MQIQASGGKLDYSIALHHFRILKVAPCAKFCDYVVRKQTAWDEGKNFDVKNLMKNTKSKYIDFVKDKHWVKNKTMNNINSIIPTHHNKCRFGTCYERGS